MRRHRPRLGALISLIAAVLTLLASLPPNAALAEGLLLPPRSSGTPLPAAGMDNAWTIVRAALPANQPVYRPTWLPARFQSAPLGPTPGPSFGVAYPSKQGDLIVFAFGPTNSSRPTRVEPITVHGIAGQLSYSDGSPPLQITWMEQGELYSVRAERGTGRNTVSRAELLKIVANLARFDSNAASVARLPQTGDESASWWLLLGGISLLVGVLVRRLARDGKPSSSFLPKDG